MKLEQGERTNELCQEVSSLLEAQLKTFPNLDVDAAVQQIVWKETRRYRVAITVDKPHLTAKQRTRLFKDYDTYAPGDIARRGAETMCLPDLRPWMQTFADKVIAKIKASARQCLIRKPLPSSGRRRRSKASIWWRSRSC